MVFVLPVFYLLLFIFLIWKMKFFHFEGLSRMQLAGLFLLKVAAGAGVLAIYTYYYPRSDFHVYFNSSKIAFDHFLGQDPSSSIPGWDSNFDDAMFNSSRIMIWVNFLIHFLSFNSIFVHILFFCFFSFVGLTALYRSLYSYFTDKKTVLMIGVYLVPSVLFWTAGIYKEAITIFCLGLLIRLTDFGLLKTYSYSKVAFVLLLCILLFFTKMYVAAAVFPLLLVNFIIARTGFKKIILKYLLVFFTMILIVHLFSKVSDQTNIYQLLADKQAKAVSEAKGGIFLVSENNFIRLDITDKNALLLQPDSTYLIKKGSNYLSWELDNMQDTTYVVNSSDSAVYKIYYELQPANSVLNIRRIKPSIVSICKNIPFAIMNVFIQPTLFSIKNALQLLSWIENMWILLIIVLAILFFDKKNLQRKEILLFCLFLGIFQFAVIGLVTPSIGAMVRYKAAALPFIVTACLLCIDFDRLYRKIKRN